MWTGAVAIFLALTATLWWRKSCSNPNNEPPSLPYNIPFVGHALRLGKNANAVYLEARNFTHNSIPVSLTVMGQRIYVVTSDTDISAVYRATKSLSFGYFMLWGMENMFGMTPQGRAILARETDGPESALVEKHHDFYRDAFKETPSLAGRHAEFTKKTLKQLYSLLADLQRSLDSSGVVVVNLRAWTRTLLGTASTNAMMGEEFLQHNPSLLDALWVYDRDMFTFASGVPSWLLPRATANRQKILTAFAAYKSKDDASWWVPEFERMHANAGMAPDDISITTFGSWHALEGNANPASFWLLAQVIKDPKALASIRKEVDPAFNTHGELESLEILVNQSPLLRSTYFEVLRFASASVSVRYVLEDTVISGYTVKKGATVMCPRRPYHFDTRVWGPDADIFVADRFIRESKNGVKRGAEAQVKPFGGGVTLCPGRHLAMNKILAFVAILVHRYDLTLAEGESIPPVNAEAPAGGMAGPTHDMKVQVRMRS